MTTTIKKVTAQSASLIAMLALVFGSIGAPLFQASVAHATEGDVTVTIDKFIDGEMATAGSAGSLSFPMSATWNATNIGAGTGSYDLAAGNAVAYEATTAEMSSGADYSTNEITGGDVVGASCEAEQPFALVGYTTGESLAEAQAGTPSLVAPAFTGMTTDKFVIVWNEDCSTPPPAPETVQVIINKFIDGTQATASSTNSASFPMSATWNDPMGVGAGTGTYSLDTATTPAYEAQTIEMNQGADYSTNEITGGEVVGASCSTEQPFALVGYTTGSSAAAAAAGTPSLTVPAFTGLTSDKYVVVWNEDCSDDASGSIGGDVTGGSSPEGDLSVTSIEATDTSATADGSFENGWEYIFYVTVPTNETNLSMKFANWTSGANSISVAGNMRISSAQADNSGATVLITAANTYSTPPLHITSDLDAGTPGLQIAVIVEAAVPSGTVNGSYTTNYGVQTLP